MFKKKPNIKQLSPLRSSDRRRIADQIIADCHVLLPPSSGNDADQNPQGDLAALRNSILPDDSLSAKFTTTVGPDNRPVSGTVYVGSHNGGDQRVLWIKYEEQMYPTVYTLWHNPRLVPLLHTPSLVMTKLRGGADLMIPGLLFGPPFPPLASKGSIVAVASMENPGLPLFVGVCEIAVNALENVQGQKGKAVRGFHWAGDEMWEWSTAGKAGTIPDRVDGWDDEKSDNVDSVEEGVKLLAVDDSDRAGEDEGRVQDTERGLPSEAVAIQPDDISPDGFAANEEVEILTKGKNALENIDEAFRQAFLYGVYHFKTSHPDDPKHGLDYPLTTSFVMAELVLPYLPIFTSAEATAYQLKKTSWKNIRKFVKTLEKQSLVKSKDRNGGETVILDIDFTNPAALAFTPYELPKKGKTGAEKSSKEATADPSKDNAVGQRLRRLVFYKPKDSLAPIFKAGNAGLKSTYTANEIRPLIKAYTEAESLVSPTNQRMVKMNPVLANVVFNSASVKDREILARGEVTREILTERVLQACSPLWAILHADQTQNDVKPKAGAPPNIHIVMETRSGNKTVTKVSGVEPYHINAQALADELQKSCASSTSVNQLVGSSPKNPSLEVMVQGPQAREVVKALEKRGVNPQWVETVDKTKGKKK
ncbi:MAG: hypothetical protein M1826_002602 [Phylliscum demangeonii]|nr:MAG: hypothetical protein M1826_002602 [Phylliscum demangeonii]